MRTITKIRNEVLTAEEWEAVEQHLKKPLLYRLLAECGYDVKKMWPMTYESSELRERAIASIRKDKLTIKELRGKLAEIRKENEARAQILFDFCKKESLRETA